MINIKRLMTCASVMLLMACTPITETEATPATPPVYRMKFGEGERYAIVADSVTGCQYIRYTAGFGNTSVAAMVPRYEYSDRVHETYRVRGCASGF